MRRVQIDNQSINSVGLEEEQHWNYRRLLVSLASIAIIFAPTTQLRLDEEGKVRRDALCSLAFNLHVK
ncbi:unnamed protein product [Rotaria sordida]|uniref:Uncharacterized protein n=1 Tax=Rotaria sordida TaxID=392033 RepID=A0A819CNL4_9BILA|nr:unnamed protein product [Rotaria sordida]